MANLTKREMFEKFGAAVIGLEVESVDGDVQMGSAFHVGRGVFLTARHNLEGRSARPVLCDDRYKPDRRRDVVRGLFHPKEDIDVGCFRLTGDYENLPWVHLGSALDDWINDEAFITSNVLVIGYPRIPLAKFPVPVTVSAEVVAIADLYIGPHPRFILSCTARGGFSGGFVYSEWDFTLGMITQSLVADNKDVETGYFAAISVEPLYECLAHNGLLPPNQSDQWGEFWEGEYPGSSTRLGETAT